MPTIADNLSWGTYNWEQRGDEWSTDWGDPTTQWNATLFPRIYRFLPASRILEIAPGYGRWTQFLIGQSKSYIGVDLNPECIDACRKRFGEYPSTTFVANDGKSLDAAEDNSIDFAFSFDSLVHVEADVLAAYFKELTKKLTVDGVAFLHHSNLAEYDGVALKISKALWTKPKPWPVGVILKKLQISDWDGWRAPSVSANIVSHLATEAGLSCIRQEVINWGQNKKRLIDCLSTLTRKGSRWDQPQIQIRNPHFMSEAASARAISSLYQSL